MAQIHDTTTLFAKEQELLAAEKTQSPELFVSTPQADTREQLARVGITMPYDTLPAGYLKYTPFDFIVEEIGRDGALHDVMQEGEGLTALDPTAPTLYADLVKVVTSSIDAGKALAQGLGIEETQIGNAGIKDTYALTSQQVSIRGVDLSRLHDFTHPHLFLKNLKSGKGALQPGDLQGNRFTILLRTKEGEVDSEVLAWRLGELQTRGAWNFFWTQRFGNRLLSHWWGLLLCQGRYEEVVKSYISDVGSRELPYYRLIRESAAQVFDDPQAMVKVLEALPYTMRHELIMARYLAEHPRDYVGALSQLPEQVKLWLYAYGSFLFNRALSWYVEDGGECPEALPLLYSNIPAEREYYTYFLKLDGVPPDFERHIAPFPYIRFQSRSVPTKTYPKILAHKMIPQGIVLCFELGKGSYATTMLAHLFDQVAGMPVPSWVDTREVDTKEVLGMGSLRAVYDRFAPHITPKESGEGDE